VSSRSFEVDRVDADADLLDQPQARRRCDHLLRRGLEHVPQHFGLSHVMREGVAIPHGTDRHLEPGALQAREPFREIRTGVVMEDDLH